MKILLLTLLIVARMAQAQVTIPDAQLAPGVVHPIGRAEDLVIRDLTYRPLQTMTNEFSLRAPLAWTIVTNWADANYSMTTAMAWTGPNNPNVTTHFEHGTVSSNLIATIVWKGRTNTVVLESLPFTRLTRSYTTRLQRVYQD